MYGKIALITHIVRFTFCAHKLFGQRFFPHIIVFAYNYVIFPLHRLLIHQLAHIGRDKIIAVHKKDIFAHRLCDTKIARMAYTLVFDMVHMQYIPVFFFIFLQNLHRLVRAPVIHSYNLNPVKRLAAGAVKALAQIVLYIIYRYNDTYLYIRHNYPSWSENTKVPLLGI